MAGICDAHQPSLRNIGVYMRTALGPVLTLKLSAQDFKARVLQDSAAMLAVKKLAQARLARTAKLDAQTLEEADLVEDTRV